MFLILILFKNIRNWIKQIEQNAQNNVCKVLVGNKCDKSDRVVSFEDGKKLAQDFGMEFFETSAKSNINVSETFTFLTKEILKGTEGGNTKGGDNIQIDKTGQVKKKGNCC